jgi:hypothetical protein
MLELLTHSKSGPAECGGVSPPTERRATYVSAFQPIFDIDQGGIIAGVLALACRYVLGEFITVHASALIFHPDESCPCR